MIESAISASFKYHIVRNGSVINEELTAVDTPTITMSTDSELKMSLSGTFLANDNVNLLTDKIKPIATINGVDYNCGEYCITTAPTRHANGKNYLNLTAYSNLYKLKQKSIETKLHYAVGTSYYYIIDNLINEVVAGRSIIEGLSSPLASHPILATDREDWEIGTNYLTIVNKLLSEINYNSLWVDLNGNINATKYALPSIDNIGVTYNADQYSIISSDYTIDNDWFGKYNVFIVQVSNPDIGTPMQAISVNDSPSSRFSTLKLGRILAPPIKLDNIASQDELQFYADRIKNESLLSNEIVDFTTAINPKHACFNAVALNNGSLQGVYGEWNWTMPLSAHEKMTHQVKRAVFL